MAIDRAKAKRVMDRLEKLLNWPSHLLPAAVKHALRDHVFGEAYKRIRRIICDGRTPVLLVFGRPGQGKSSLINALVGREVAGVGEPASEGRGCNRYDTSYPERYAALSVIEVDCTLGPTGGRLDRDFLGDAVRRHRPDVLLHVISALDAAAVPDDTAAVREALPGPDGGEQGGVPAVIVLTKVDGLDPECWPPGAQPRSADAILGLISSIARSVCGVRDVTPLDGDASARGGMLPDNTYRAIIPVCTWRGSEPTRPWNLDRLADLIADLLPDEARLAFAQALGRTGALKKMSTDLISQFARIAAAVGAAPLPFADILLLTPLQLAMIMVVGGLSCREMSKKTAREFIAALGLTGALGFGLRTAFRQLVKLWPGPGWAAAAAIAGAGTYGIGKSAEAYFFSHERKGPEMFWNEWEPA